MKHFSTIAVGFIISLTISMSVSAMEMETPFESTAVHSSILRGELCNIIYESLDLPAPEIPNPFADIQETDPYYSSAISLFDAGIFNGIYEDEVLFARLDEALSPSEGAELFKNAYQFQQSASSVMSSVAEPDSANIPESPGEDIDRSAIIPSDATVYVKKSGESDYLSNLPEDVETRLTFLDENGEENSDWFIDDIRFVSVSGGNISDNILLSEINDYIEIIEDRIIIRSGLAFDNEQAGIYSFLFEVGNNALNVPASKSYRFGITVHVLDDDNNAALTQAFLHTAAEQIQNLPENNIFFDNDTITIKKGFPNLYNPRFEPEIEGVSLSISGVDDLKITFTQAAKEQLVLNALDNNTNYFSGLIAGNYNEHTPFQPVRVSIQIDPFIEAYIQKQVTRETAALINALAEPSFSFENEQYLFSFDLSKELLSSFKYLEALDAHEDFTLNYMPDMNRLSITLEPDFFESHLSDSLKLSLFGEDSGQIKGEEQVLVIEGYNRLVDMYKVYEELTKEFTADAANIQYDTDTEKWSISYGPFSGTNGENILLKSEDGNISEAKNGYITVYLNTTTPIERAEYDEGQFWLEAKNQGGIGFELFSVNEKHLSLQGSIPYTSSLAKQIDSNLVYLKENVENFIGSLYNGGRGIRLNEGSFLTNLPQDFITTFSTGSGDAVDITLDYENNALVFEPADGTGHGNYLVNITYSGFEIPAGYFKYQYND